MGYLDKSQNDCGVGEGIGLFGYLDKSQNDCGVGGTASGLDYTDLSFPGVMRDLGKTALPISTKQTSVP